MSDADSQHDRSTWHSALVLSLFVGSGCAALIYEIVWFQLLQLVIGSSAVSLGLLLATFMGGMCLGSLALAPLVSPRRHPLRVYAALEFGIGVCGLAALYVIPELRGIYLELLGRGYSDLLLRGALCAACLLPPTALMGATLPAVARWVERSPHGTARLGLFYGGNTIGGVGGCLLAGFYLLRVYDIAVSTHVAVAINLAVAGLSAVLASRLSHAGDVAASRDESLPETQGRAWLVYVAIALSGCTALGAEVVWTRLLSLMFNGTTYTFSLILAMFLVGIGLGSTLGSYVAERLTVRARRLGHLSKTLAGFQLLLVVAMTWTVTAVIDIAARYRHQFGADTSPWFAFGVDVLWCALVIVPPAICWGASFPAALFALNSSNRDVGRLVGRVYAANTAGAIVGSLAFSLWLLPALGTQHAQQLLMSLALVAGGCAAFAARRFTLRAVVSLLGGVMLIAAVPAVPFTLITSGRLAPVGAERMHELYRGEGTNATIAVSEWDDGVRSFHISGRVEASSNRVDVRTERMIGLLPAVIHPEPKAVLVVGFGAGVTAGTFLGFFETERIVICEIEPLIPEHVGPYFKDYNLDIVEWAHDTKAKHGKSSPQVEIVYDDARHYVLTTPEKFDLITSDPIHPWLRGAAALYTAEYFENVKAHLRPGGVVSQWLPLYESNTAAVKSVIATFFEVFPHGSIWTNTKYGTHYDLVLVGSAEPLVIDIDKFEERLRRPGSVFVMQMLTETSFDKPLDLLASFAVGAQDLKPWLADAEINRDRNLRLQYLAGLTPRGTDGERIERAIKSYRRLSPDVFTGSPELLKALEAALDAAPK